MQLTQKLAILVDAQNLYYSFRRQYNGRVDYGKLLERVASGRPVMRAITYVICSPETDATNFLTALKQMGYEVKSKALKARPDGSVKGDWDMMIALDAIAIGEKVDTICLVTGDSDFADLVNVLKARGVRVECFGVRGSFAEELQRLADAAFFIDEHMLRHAPGRSCTDGNGHRDATIESAPEIEPSPSAINTRSDNPLAGLRGVTDVPRHED